MDRNCVGLLLALAIGLAVPATGFATAGLAEWEIRTPGGNVISHIDPLKARYGDCLRKPDDTAGLISDRPQDVFVSHLEWWQYYPGHVVGKGRGGYFVFAEASRAVTFVPTESRLADEIRRRGLAAPLSARLTAADGWNEAWLPLYRDRCAKLAAGDPAFATLGEPERQAMRALCARLGSGVRPYIPDSLGG
jgi:hypothetical protein